MNNGASTKWYDKKQLVILLIIFFLPVGVYGLIRSSKFHKVTKWLLSFISIPTICFITLIIYFMIFPRHGDFPSYTLYKEAKELDIHSYNEYQDYLVKKIIDLEVERRELEALEDSILKSSNVNSREELAEKKKRMERELKEIDSLKKLEKLKIDSLKKSMRN